MSPDVRTAPTRPATGDDGDWERRKRQVLTAAGIIAALAVVAAAVLWYAGSSGSSKTAPLPRLTVAAGDHALVLGPTSAPHTVVVHEDFADPASKQWDQATRDYLRADATAGLVRVEYHPVAFTGSGYGADAAIAFATVLQGPHAGAARAALTLHGVLFDHRGDATATTADALARWAGAAGGDARAVRRALSLHDTSWLRAANAQARKAGVRRVPQVLLDGRPIPGATLLERADALERALAGS
ncbi:MAG: DsbA family protein [Marmoricola sp.]